MATLVKWKIGSIAGTSFSVKALLRQPSKARAALLARLLAAELKWPKSLDKGDKKNLLSEGCRERMINHLVTSGEAALALASPPAPLRARARLAAPPLASRFSLARGEPRASQPRGLARGACERDLRLAGLPGSRAAGGAPRGAAAERGSRSCAQSVKGARNHKKRRLLSLDHSASKAGGGRGGGRAPPRRGRGWARRRLGRARAARRLGPGLAGGAAGKAWLAPAARGASPPPPPGGAAAPLAARAGEGRRSWGPPAASPRPPGGARPAPAPGA